MGRRTHCELVLISSSIIVAVLLGNCFSRDLFEGDACTNGDNTRGICTNVLNCSAAVKQIKRYRLHKFTRCGFDGSDEIACCPLTDSRNPQPDTRLNDRKCSQKCQDYAKTRPIALNFNILNGVNADESEFPHMAALAFYVTQDSRYSFMCGGTLISERHVITAAHCIVNISRDKVVFVRMGTIRVPPHTTKMDARYDYAVDNITVHPQYNRLEKQNDIAIILLNRTVKFNNNIAPACLYTLSDEPEHMFITGWGDNDFGGQHQDILQKAPISAFPRDRCNSTIFGRVQLRVTEKQLCAHDNKTDACQGDSGGPIQTQMPGMTVCTLVGITSYGINCGSNAPGVYTRVYSYLDWIESIVWP